MAYWFFFFKDWGKLPKMCHSLTFKNILYKKRTTTINKSSKITVSVCKEWEAWKCEHMNAHFHKNVKLMAKNTYAELHFKGSNKIAL